MSAARIDNLARKRGWHGLLVGAKRRPVWATRVLAIRNTACEQAVPPAALRPPGIRPRNGHFAFGFTMVELLVVIMLIALLVAIMVPTIRRVKQNIQYSITQTTINTLESACQMYSKEKELGEYPPSQPVTDFYGRGPAYGGQRLVEALTGYIVQGTFRPTGELDPSGDGDGCEGFGFRMYQHGTKFGPYNGAEKAPTTIDTPPYFADSLGGKILYYRFDQRGSDTSPRYYADADPNINGPADADTYAKNSSGVYYRRDFILISAGFNETYSAPADDRRTDDVMNLFNQ